jgi:hypothetical protein
MENTEKYLLIPNLFHSKIRDVQQTEKCQGQLGRTLQYNFFYNNEAHLHE